MSRAGLGVVALVLALGLSVAAVAATAPAERDVLALATAMERTHPDLFASTPRARFRAEARALARRAPALSRPRLVVGLMRLVALAGARNGHTAVYPFDAHPRPLRVYPVRLYAFPSGSTSWPPPAGKLSSGRASRRSRTSPWSGSSRP